MCRLAGQADMGDPDILISREKGEISPLAICSVLEAGKKVN